MNNKLHNIIDYLYRVVWPSFKYMFHISKYENDIESS